MYYIGIDVGSTYTKYCIMDGEGTIKRLFSEKTPVRQKKHFEDKLSRLRSEYPNCRIVSCGYGRKNIGGQQTVNELTALAAGAGILCPQTEVILDIGGQDTKIIRQERGKLREFFVNDRCAAGCGMFLKNVLEMLELRFEDLHISARNSRQPELVLSSVCAVFAQTEIVEAIAADISAEQIVRAVLHQIFTQAKTLLAKMECCSLALSGGLTDISGICPFAEDILGRPIVIPKYAKYLSAIGSASIGRMGNIQ